MKKGVFWALFVLGFLFLSGCSMLPNDEDIINGSVLENEIFGNDLDDEIVENIELDNENLNIDIEVEDNNSIEEDSDEPLKVEIQEVE